jgi:hypothetical protein
VADKVGDMNAPATVLAQRAQRRRVRRNALLLGLIALAIYTSFIVHSVLRGLQ